MFNYQDNLGMGMSCQTISTKEFIFNLLNHDILLQNPQLPQENVGQTR